MASTPLNEVGRAVRAFFVAESKVHGCVPALLLRRRNDSML